MSIEEALVQSLRPMIRELVQSELRAGLAALRQVPASSGGEPEYLTINEVAALTRSDRTTVERWIRDGRLSRVTAGGKRLVPRTEVLRFMTTSAGEATSESDDDKVERLLGRRTK